MDIADIRKKIEQRAYELWETDGRPMGRDVEHWLRAEAELNGQLPVPVKPRPVAPVPVREPSKRPQSSGGHRRR